MKDLFLSDILRKGYNIYRNNFKLLFKTSLLYVLIQFISSQLSRYTGLSESGLSFLIGFILMFAVAYFGLRIYISLIIIVQELIKGKHGSLISAYHESSQYFWKTIGNYILLALPILVPLYLLNLVYRSEISLLYRYLLIIVCIGVIGIVATYLFFAPLSVVLNPNLTKRIRYSVRIVQRRVLTVFAILFISSFVFFIPIYYIRSIELGAISVSNSFIIKDIIINVINLIILPFSTSVYVVLYNELIRLESNNI